MNKQQIKAIVECIGEGLTSVGILDDVGEIVYANLTDNDGGMTKKSITITRQWAKNWDIAIAFHNEHCTKKQRYSKPWVTKEVEDTIKYIENQSDGDPC